MKSSGSSITAFVVAQLAREHGQALVEYALILALIALVAVGGLEFVAGPAPGFFSKVGSLIGQ